MFETIGSYGLGFLFSVYDFCQQPVLTLKNTARAQFSRINQTPFDGSVKKSGNIFHMAQGVILVEFLIVGRRIQHQGITGINHPVGVQHRMDAAQVTFRRSFVYLVLMEIGLAQFSRQFP